MAKSILNTELLRRRIREKFGTQSEFARRCGWSRQYLSRVLNGQAQMSLRRLSELAAALDLGPEQILHSQSVSLGQDPVRGESREQLIREVAAQYAVAAAARDSTEEEIEKMSATSAPEASAAGQPPRQSSWLSSRQFATDEERIAFVRSLQGKYRWVPNDTEGFMRRKQEEKEREDRQDGIRP